MQEDSKGTQTKPQKTTNTSCSSFDDFTTPSSISVSGRMTESIEQQWTEQINYLLSSCVCFTLYMLYHSVVYHRYYKPQQYQSATEDYLLLCTAEPFDPWLKPYMLMIAGASTGQVLALWFRYTFSLRRMQSHVRYPLASRFILFLATMKAFASIGFYADWIPTTCQDFLGVKTHFFIWFEWLTTVPYMFFLVSMMDSVKHQTMAGSAMMALRQRVQLLGTSSLCALFCGNLSFLPRIIQWLLFIYANIAMIFALSMQQVQALRNYHSAKDLYDKVIRFQPIDKHLMMNPIMTSYVSSPCITTSDTKKTTLSSTLQPIDSLCDCSSSLFSSLWTILSSSSPQQTLSSSPVAHHSLSSAHIHMHASSSSSTSTSTSTLVSTSFASKTRYFANKAIERQSFDNLYIAQCKMKCTLFMSFSFTLFPLIYYLNYLQMIDSESFILLTYTCSYFSKVLFTHFIADSHVEVLDPNKFIVLEQRRKFEKTRLNCLRYVLHGVKVPLNSLILGLQSFTSTSSASNTSNNTSNNIFKSTSSSTSNIMAMNTSVKKEHSTTISMRKMKASDLQEERETLTMMQEATGFMSETLNDILSLQKIEQDMFEMEYKVFAMERLLTTCLMNFR
jgi:hypothetical protein